MFPYLKNICINRSSRVSTIKTSCRGMCVEKIGPPNLLLGGLAKYTTILAGTYLLYCCIEIMLYRDSPVYVRRKVIKLLNEDGNATKALGKDIRPTFNERKDTTFQYPENDILKLDMTFRVMGSIECGDVHVRARQDDNPKYYKYNWIFETINVKLQNGIVIPVKVK